MGMSTPPPESLPYGLASKGAMDGIKTGQKIPAAWRDLRAQTELRTKGSPSAGSSADGATPDVATVIQVGPELPSPEAATAVASAITERLSSEPSRAMAAVSNLDAARINQLLSDD